MRARKMLLTALAAGLVALMLPLAPTASASVLVDEFDVSASAIGPTVSTVALNAGTTYAIASFGSYGYGGFLGGEADAACHNAASGTPMVPFLYDVVGFANNALDLLVNGNAVDWLSLSFELIPGCDLDNQYYVITTPETSGPVSFQVNDVNPFDNTGSLRIQIYQLP